MPINAGAILGLISGSSPVGQTADLIRSMLSSQVGGLSARGAIQGVSLARSQIDAMMVPGDFIGKMGPCIGTWFIDDFFVQPF